MLMATQIIIRQLAVVLLLIAVAPRCACAYWYGQGGAPSQRTAAAVAFEKPVLLGVSAGGAINASCGGGRFWFPAGGYAIDNETLAVTISLTADGNLCPASSAPHEVVHASFDAGRSWVAQWFVGPSHLPKWRGLPSGPAFCGAAGTPVPAGSGGGMVCPDHGQPAAVGKDGTGELVLTAVVWRRVTVAGKPQLEVKQAICKASLVLRCPVGAGTVPGRSGWEPGPVQAVGGPADGALFRVATCERPPAAGAGPKANGTGATQVVMKSVDGGTVWETISTVPAWTDLYTAGKYPRGA